MYLLYISPVNQDVLHIYEDVNVMGKIFKVKLKG